MTTAIKSIIIILSQIPQNSRALKKALVLFGRQGKGMTDKELHKLKRSELLELMFNLQKEIDNLRNENTLLKNQIGVFTQTALQAKASLSETALQDITKVFQQVADRQLMQIQEMYTASQSNEKETGQ